MEGRRHRPTGRSQAPHGEVAPRAVSETWWIGTLPFALLLGAIAVFPLLPAVAHWWHSNLNRYIVSLAAAGLALAYIGFDAGAIGVGNALHHAVPAEYLPFMSLLFALYVIAGGLRIETPFDGHPRENLSLLAVGALIASFVGSIVPVWMNCVALCVSILAIDGSTPALVSALESSPPVAPSTPPLIAPPIGSCGFVIAPTSAFFAVGGRLSIALLSSGGIRSVKLFSDSAKLDNAPVVLDAPTPALAANSWADNAPSPAAVAAAAASAA